ncbi:MAG: ATP-dependent zinc metalloprotease FtsH [Tissierellia bacterium]|nr:ATP-dependent zinc metalloprotease FtsH [Tissierellia bacterium]
MKRRMGGTGFYIILLLLLVGAIRIISPPSQTVPEKSYDQLVKAIDSREADTIEAKQRIFTVTLKSGDQFKTFVPEFFAQDIQDHLKEPVEKGEITVQGFPEDNSGWLIQLLPNLLIIIGIFFLWYMMFQNSQGGGGKMMNFGKSKAREFKEDPDNLVTFEQVAGLQEEKEELGEIVDFLKNPRKFVNMGARIPKGVLMVGPPGTGKTYLSKAVAGEAKVPFFTISGSDFVEMFVGVGASRVRDLFETAKKNAPCIIFIDEIDAVGRRRGAGVGGGHDEREQTLNQLLVEMDGFGTNEGVIVMAATNRADILDPALLRPGRFDRTVFVGVPDVRGREQILEIHSKKKPLSKEVNLRTIARQTPGFTPADLENLMNEAALLAARRNEAAIQMEDVEEANIKVQAGPAKKSKVVSETERKLTAVHEAGHAIVSRALPGHDPVHMITIIPRGMAGGFTAYIPEDDVNFMTKGEMENKLVSLLGGRVSESLVLDDISTGASNDIERATKIARDMVTRYGMSDKLGTINYGTDEEQVFMGRDFGRHQEYSEKVASEIDSEIRDLIHTAYNRAEDILKENMDILLRVSDALLERETINGKEFEILYQGGELEKEENDDFNHDESIQKSDLSQKATKIVEEMEKEKTKSEDSSEE